jgi:hypothetical protein
MNFCNYQYGSISDQLIQVEKGGGVVGVVVIWFMCDSGVLGYSVLT